MFEATSGMMVRSMADLRDKAPLEPVCLGTFSKVVTVTATNIKKVRDSTTGIVTEVEETEEVEKLAIASVFSCRADIEFIIAMQAAGISVALQADGTYRLLNVGWVLLVIGLTYNGWDTSEHSVVHHFVPLVHTLCLTECKEPYAFSMRVVADIPALFAKEAPLPALVVEDGEAASPAVAPILEAASPAPPRLEASSVNIDCCSSIANAVMVV
jgi:hypothetical protein